jgi:hypothetical protein
MTHFAEEGPLMLSTVLRRARPLAALAVTATLLVPAVARAATVVVRDDDGSREATLAFDWTDDTATKDLNVAPADLGGATSARLWVYASAQNCGTGTGAQAFDANGTGLGAFDPCTAFSATAYGWTAFPVPLGALAPGVNRFAAHDDGASSTDRGSLFGIDTGHDYGRSIASANGGADLAGELMWYLEITKEGPPAGRAHITIHRFSSGGAFLLAAPTVLGWTCVDARTGATVGIGSPLTLPDPGVRCTPPVAGDCTSLDAGGYHAAAGLGTLTVTSTCGALSVSQSMTLPFSDPGYSSFVTGSGSTPWGCSADESRLGGLGDPDYWVFCDENLV